MEAISKKRLRQWKRIAAQKGLDGLKSMELLDLLIEECKELDPWLPITDAPKDRPLILWNGSAKCLAYWLTDNKSWYVVAWFGGGPEFHLDFTHYKEVPEDPKE